ncbi:hypothetical protein BC629DRAFT_47848 [Irpex lacteus]|nr:hypothetical protein BC629DRAFT_47848 [Irpex lacteus]
MSSLRQKASRFFRVKSSSSSGSDSGSVKTEAGIIEGKNKRAKSMPLDTSPYAGDIDQTGDVQGLTVSSSLPVISMPIPELVDAKGSPATALEGLGVLESKADEVIQVDNERSAKNAKLNDKVAIFKSFNDTLQFKSTAQDIMSQAKNGLGDDPWFMRALDDVAKIHPFVSVAVIAFKACYNMEMARRQNDKRVIALFREMKEMIEVLVRLKDITDPQVLGLNGNMIRGKLQTLVDAAAQDIKDCGNACDVWMKKTVLVKVLVGPAWEGRLAAFTSGFAARRMEFEFALQIHTASGVDAIQAVTTAMNDRLAQMSQQFALAFSQMRSPEELRLAEVVRSKGGVDAVKNNDAVLRELFKAEKPPTHSKGTPVASAAGNAKALQGGDGTKDQRVSDKSVQRSEYTFSDFKVELREDWDTALQSNLEAFEGKFRLFYDQLEASLHRYMQEESNRVIEEVTKGPHNLIQEPELRIIWQEMHWRRNVKARKFVVTLRDHFADSVQVSSAQDKPENSSTLELATDNWARQYVDVKYLQPIIDAIDDDGSGHITITEVNRFTNELPKSLGWSLMLWLAYWAIGWQTFAAKYRNEILQIFARMFAMRDRILPENRGSVDYYLRMTWPISSQLTKSLSSPLTSIPESHEEKFKEYVQFEEDRLRNNLVRIKYDIDAVETVYGVMGPGRIEKNLLALLALILRRDLELFDLATRSRLHIEELWDAADSILLVSYAVYSRYQDLVVQFQQQRLDVGQAMKTIACELFDYYHDSSSLDKMSYALAAKEQEPTDEQLPSAQLGDMQPNNYPIPTEWPYDCEGYNAASELLTEADLAAPDGVKLL